tara:strand:+ start:1145 stop:1285 length:141 start_codon:yes stop_codon:yes gene_type:complete
VREKPKTGKRIVYYQGAVGGTTLGVCDNAADKGGHARRATGNDAHM